MSMAILRSMQEIRDARDWLRQKGVSCEPGLLSSLLLRLGIPTARALGGWLKSWDVAKTAEFLSENIDRNEPILDIGAYQSEVLCVLSRMGFTRLHGIDLDPRVGEAASKGMFRAHVGDFYRSHFADASFAAITAISTIEHGYRQVELCQEVSRILRPGGVFVASFDYWPDKVDTSGIRLFDLDWRVFSREEVGSLIEMAAHFDLLPIAEIALEAERRVISWVGKSYTFAWIALRRKQLQSL